MHPTNRRDEQNLKDAQASLQTHRKVKAVAATTITTTTCTTCTGSAVRTNTVHCGQRIAKAQALAWQSREPRAVQISQPASRQVGAIRFNFLAERLTGRKWRSVRRTIRCKQETSEPFQLSRTIRLKLWFEFLAIQDTIHFSLAGVVEEVW